MKEFNNKITILSNNSILSCRFFQPVYIFLFVNLFLISGCSNINKNEDINICSTTKLPCIDSNEYVLLITNKGNIKLELYGKLAPITVGNFIYFVEKDSYDKTIFNRVIKKPYPFIIRGGDNTSIGNQNKFIDTKIKDKRYIPLEIKLQTKNSPIYGKEIDISNQ